MVTCENCGRHNEDHYRFCLGCGTPLTAAKKKAPAPAAPAAAPPEGGSAWAAAPLGEGAKAGNDPSVWAMSPVGAPASDDERWSLGPGGSPRSGEESWQLGTSASLPGAPRGETTPRPARPAAPAPAKEMAYAPTAASMQVVAPAAHVSSEPPIAAQAGLPPPGPVDFHQGPTTPGFGHSREAAAGEAPAPQAASGARICSACGSTVPEGFVFCGRCGTRMAEPQMAKTMYLSGAPAALEERPRGRLLALRADGSPGESLPLRDGDNPFGRDSGIPLLAADRLLSPRHAIFSVRGRRLLVRDDGSINGVFLKIRDEWELQSGDVFRIGQQLSRYDDIRDAEILVAPAAAEDSFILGSPDLGYWGRLVQIIGQNRAGNVFLLVGAEVTLGRERAQVTFPLDGFVSATHAALVRRGEQTLLADRGSSNGTYVRLRTETPLQYGDLVLLGQNLFRVELFA